MRNIHVSYEACKALQGVDFDVFQGEIHGLVGEHRAGKSTLVKLLSGAVVKDKGDILFKGKRVDHFTPKSAMRQKIGMMYQSINVIPTLNAVENIFAGQTITNWLGGIRYDVMRRKTEEIFAAMQVDIPLDVPLEFLSQDKQQMVELAKVLSLDPEIIIFDEISSKLTPEEMEYVYKLLPEFKRQRKSVIYISHNMDEIFEVADRVTILKSGYRRGTEEMRDLDKIKLIKLTYSYVLSREELESDNRELYLLKKYNENIIKNLPEGVIILDPDNRVYIINYAAIRILAIEHLDLSSQRIETIFTSQAIHEAEDILFRIREREEWAWDELEYQHEKILKLHIFPFKDEDYKFLGTIILIEDVSKDRYFQEYFLRTEKITSVAELAAGVAHEINNPLGIIQNYVALLKRRNRDGDSLEKLNKVENELHRIVEIIGSLLSFSKLKKQPWKPLNLVTLLDEIALLLSHKIKEKHLRFTWNHQEQEIRIFGDENKLKQVFINLIVNSIEAVMYDGEIELALQLPADEKYIEVTVTDNGYGIPEDVLKHIFDPFFTTKVGKHNSGLGLSICQHIIESHQGIITCESGEKTSFHVRLPLSLDLNIEVQS
jgi:two-component system sensor histidine kinase AtoS